MKALKYCPPAVVAACVVGWFIPAESRADAGGDCRLQVGQTVEITGSHGRCWYPTIHRFRSREILVGMNMSPDEVNSESSFSAYCISKDGGETWSRRYTVGSGACQDGAWSEVPDQEDSIWQMGSYPEPRREGDATTFYTVVTKFSKAGRWVTIDRDVTFRLAEPACLYPTWLHDYRFDGKVPVSDTKIKTQFSGRTWGGIIRDPRGGWLCSVCFTTAADAVRAAEEAKHRPKARRFGRDVLLRSTDDGRTWSQYSTIATVPMAERPEWMGSEGPCEGSLAFLTDGRLYAIYRTGGQDGMIGNQWSSDDGRTWTAPASIGFHGVAPRIHRLHDGMLVVVTGRPGPVELRVNADGTGGKWSGPLVLFAGTSTHYTDVLEVQPGKLLVVYDSIPYGWYEIPFADRDARNRIYGTFVTVERK